jgi:hypothetical protein
MATKEISQKFADLKKAAALCLTQSNVEKRVVYSDIELLILDIEVMQNDKVTKSEELQKIKEELEALSGTIKLGYVNRKYSWWMKVVDRCDEVIRLVGVLLVLATSSVLVAFPCILLSPLDYLLVNFGIIDVFHQISVQVKLFLARTILLISGINVVVDGVDKKSFGKECVLTCFSHASSMDAFLLTGAIPVTALTVVRMQTLSFLCRLFSFIISFLLFF